MFFVPMAVISAATRRVGCSTLVRACGFCAAGLLHCCRAAVQAMGLGRAYTSAKLWRRQLLRARNELLLGRNTGCCAIAAAI